VLKNLLLQKFCFEKLIVPVILFHIFVSVFTYNYAVNNSTDSSLYWLLNYDVNELSWPYLFKVGTPFMVFLNYPLLKLGTPFWLGHIIYSIIGFFGIYLFAKWALEVLKAPSGNLLAFVLLAFIFFSPNLHVWTSFIGKEAIVFWSLSAIFYSSLLIKKRWVVGIIAIFLLIMIRPHVAFMLLGAGFIVLLIDRKLSFKIKSLVLGSSIILGAGLLFLMLKITRIRYLDWDRIQHYNEFSILSLKDTTGYVPMLDYNYIYKLFSLNFRPLFYDTYNTMTALASFENLISLLFVALALFFTIKYFKTLILTRWMKVAILFFMISSVLYVERYSNLGLFMRTKMMYMPFVYVAVAAIIVQSFAIKSSVENNL
jgi:hypothetical protein